MVFGMTMIKVRPGNESFIYRAVLAINGVEEIYPILGEYSFFLIVDANERRDRDRILDEIYSIEEVKEILPALVTADSEPSGISRQAMGYN